MMLILLLWEFTIRELWLWFFALSLWSWALVKFWFWFNIVRYICTSIDKAIKYLSFIISVTIISDLSIFPFSILNYRFLWLLIMIIIFIAMSSLLFHLLFPYSRCVVISDWWWVLLTSWQRLVTTFISVIIIIIMGGGCCVGTWTSHTLDLW